MTEISHFQVPAFWEEYATEQQVDMMSNLMWVLRKHTRPVYGPPNPDQASVNNIMENLIGKNAEAAVAEWTVDILMVEGDARLRTLLVNTPEGKYFLMAFPLEAIELQKVVDETADKVAALRDRVAE